jgi:hypothetical protein
MWFRDNCITCDGSSTRPVFLLLFNIDMIIILEFSSKWVKVMLKYLEGVGCLFWGEGQSVTTQRKAFKYVMDSEPYRYTHDI